MLRTQAFDAVPPPGARRSFLSAAFFLLALLAAASRVSPQVAPGAGAGTAQAADSAAALRTGEDALDDARDAQSRFERQRRQWSPARQYPWLGTDCDERIGRICLRYDEGGDWWPQPEDPRIVAARAELLEALARAARVRPRDAWLAGQRVLYLVEGGLHAEAESLARGCVTQEPAACGALLGLSLHVQGRFVEAEAAFRAALGAMDERERLEWMDPAVLLDGDGRSYLDEREEGGPLTHAEAVEKVWRLSDPLYLVAGNDRLTEHWSRRTVSSLRDGIANPYGLRWGADLEEVLVRYGWEVGWDRVIDLRGGLGGGVVGHHHPESRVYTPPGRILDAPGSANPGMWTLSPARPHDGYAPAYAPVIVPAPGELLRFPRGDRVVVVATYAIPEDTTHHSRHDHAPPAALDRQRGLAPRAGLFLVPLRGESTAEVVDSASTERALLLEAPAGEYLASTEVWVPARGFAARLREGVSAPPMPLDAPTLSDLILLASALPDSAGLERAVEVVRAPAPVMPGQPLVVGWELHGLGWRDEVVSYRMSAAREGSGFFNRVGEWLGLRDPDAPLRLTWEEPGPTRPGPAFRSLTVQIPDLSRGEYVLRLEVSLSSGPMLSSERTIHVDRP